MLKPLVCATLCLGLHTAGWAQGAAELVGKYQLEAPDGDMLELRADGSATLADQPMKWSVRGNQLTVGGDVMTYTLQNGRLLLVVGGVPVPWKKIGGASKAPTPMQAAAARVQGAAPPAANTGNVQDQQARQVLTGSAWCSFTYSQVSGSSSTRRVVFRPDGVMLVQAGGETYSSGSAGTYASQGSNATTYRWKLEALRLFVDANDGAGFQDVGLSATQNSNGAVILNSLGREYSMCR